jgi:hypothetical protein
VLNLKFIPKPFSKITYTVSCLLLAFICFICASFTSSKHPFYISVVDVKQDVKTANLNISVRMFTTDLEDALKKTTSQKIDILNPTNKAQMDSILFCYITKRLNITVNAIKQKLLFVGYEKEEESIWAYLEIKKIVKPKSIIIDTKLLYDYLPQQVNIVHTEINTIKKSSKVTNPNSKVKFDF